MSRRVARALILAGALGACDRTPVTPPPPTRVVLVTLDTVRADHLGTYGYPRHTSPFIDSLAERGVLFERAYATSASTAPAHASLFTARYPLQHGLRRNTIWLPNGTPTLAGAFRAAGWRTAAFVSAAVLDQITRIGQGFDTYAETSRPEGREFQDDRVTTERALTWLNNVPADASFFLWVHYFDAHAPYTPDPALRTALGPNSDADRATMSDWLHQHHYITPQRDDLDRIANYDAEVRSIDDQLHRLYDGIEARPGTGLWVITADHGEGLSNHDFWPHVLELYTEQLASPLIFHWSHGGPAPRRVPAPVVSQVDVAPTLLDLAGLPSTALPRPEGASLRPLLEGSGMPFPLDRAVFAQYGGEHDRCEDLFAIYRLDRALITPLRPGPERFYAIDDDRYQTVNRDGMGLPEQDRLREQLRTLVARFVTETGGYDDLTVIRDRPALERLRALGYVQ